MAAETADSAPASSEPVAEAEEEKEKEDIGVSASGVVDHEEAALLALHDQVALEVDRPQPSFAAFYRAAGQRGDPVDGRAGEPARGGTLGCGRRGGLDERERRARVRLRRRSGGDGGAGDRGGRRSRSAGGRGGRR